MNSPEKPVPPGSEEGATGSMQGARGRQKGSRPCAAPLGLAEGEPASRCGCEEPALLVLEGGRRVLGQGR